MAAAQASSSLDATAAAPLAAEPRRDAVVLLLGALVILALSVSAALVLWRSRADNLRTWERTLGHFSATVAEHASQTFRTADFVLDRVVDRVESEHLHSDAELRSAFGSRAMHELLRERADDTPLLDALLLVALDGSVVNAARVYPSTHLSVADRDYFRAHQADPMLERYISEPLPSRASGRWDIFMARKIHGADGRLLGLAVVGLQVGYFERFYGGIRLGEAEGAALLLRSDGVLLARHPPNAEMLGRSYRNSPGMRALAEAMARGEQAATVRTSAARLSNPADTQPRLSCSHAVAGFPLVVSVTATESLLLRDWRRTAWFIGVTTLALDALVAALVLWIFRLLRRRRAALGQLDAARSAAESASRVKSQFLANMSHEIRTPLHGMLGMARQLLAAPLPPAQLQQAQVIERSGRLLLGVIDDVLDFSRIEAGRMEMERSPFDLVHLVRDCIALYQAQAQAKGLALRLEMAPPAEAAGHGPVLGDPLRLSQVLNNLLSNAIKFTGMGSVVLRVQPRAEGHWRLAVADTGMGLDEAEQQRIFQPFMQSDSSTTRRFGGSGLGLAIARSLVQLQGGELGVNSRLGEGSEFWFTLPLPPAPAAAAMPTPKPVHAGELSGRRALVAEDNEVNMELACAILEGLGMDADRAADGVQAVEAFEKTRPAVVLMDMHMPLLDGLGAARCIRTLEQEQGLPRTPILALTASALADDRRLCLEAGMDAVLVKPFDMDQLRMLLHRHLSLSDPHDG
ncbi:hybrid sensor histidine kinase/response regulator [Azohydromonas lata]|uniref:hybrid sensor histidine kinase/response regulator n=1 Tax=Azohydromonas lata TaxID=45677 RepID=UPI00083709A1|nr:hybrid sensor histidine kinase/response regulator [Azohydromonas lata]